MKVSVNGATLELVQGDITREKVDAIVNAANSALRPGGGVDGAITRAAGQAALEARLLLGRCPTGEARIGPAGALNAKYIIYAVGPVYGGGQRGEPDLLASAYRHSLDLCVGRQCESIAFPAISTGVYGYPMADAAKIALTTIIDFLKSHDLPRLVRVVLFDSYAYNVWVDVLKEVQ